MAPPRKKAKTAEMQPTCETLVSDFRTRWLVDGENLQTIKLAAEGGTLVVNRGVLVANSEYFKGALKPGFIESKGEVKLPDIHALYLGLYVGIAHSFMNMCQPAEPKPQLKPEAYNPISSLKEWIEVLNLCDYFLSEKMAQYVTSCISIALFDGHRALYRSHLDENQQLYWMCRFADGYEALHGEKTSHKKIQQQLIDCFCGGIAYDMWMKNMEHIVDRPGFIGAVSLAFAKKLLATQGRKLLKRKEMTEPPNLTDAQRDTPAPNIGLSTYPLDMNW